MFEALVFFCRLNENNDELAPYIKRLHFHEEDDTDLLIDLSKFKANRQVKPKHFTLSLQCCFLYFLFFIFEFTFAKDKTWLFNVCFLVATKLFHCFLKFQFII